MIFDFDTLIAQKFGLYSAIFMRYFLKRDAEIISLSQENLSDLFPFWTKRQVTKILKTLTDSGLIEQLVDDHCRSNSVQSYKINTDLAVKSTAYISSKNNRFMTERSHLEQEKYSKEFLNDFEHNQTVMNRIDYNQILLVLCSAQISTLTVIKLYKYQRRVIILTTLILLILYNKYNKEIKKQKSLKPKEKKMRNIPASSEHIFNSRFVLAELNNLLVPTIRRKPYPPSSPNLGPIIKQLKNGATMDDCLHVVKVKFEEWHNTPVMHSSLQPKTLFGEKFENYEGQKLKGKDNEKNNNVNRPKTTNDRTAEALSNVGRAVLDALAANESNDLV